MREFLLYCAGPINGLPYAETVDWREQVAIKLPPNIKAVSPMRGKKYLSSEQAMKESYEEHQLASRKGIATRDRMDVMRSDAVLVNLLGAKKVSIGSVIEIAWADILRKPIIVAMDEGNIHSHAIIREVAGFIVPTLDEAIEIAISVLSPTT